ncbi:MAG: hypothetical protein K6G40_09770 [Eubacterium sp.]|nr:hypothetical protein [Eubacterium sp.]
MNKDNDIIKRFTELRNKSRDCFIFTEFLSPEESSLVYRAAYENEFTLSGGFDDAERVVIRFGNKDELGYEIPFPIALMQISPLNKKFSDTLSHRDYLGALMNLGIERKMLGDIIIKDNEAYVFVLEHMTTYISENLTRVKHTSIKTELISELPEDVRPKYKEDEEIVPSLRIDAIISKIYNLSRGGAKELFSAGKVFVNSRLCINPDYQALENDVISVRGFGKFTYICKSSETKKGNAVIKILKRI